MGGDQVSCAGCGADLDPAARWCPQCARPQDASAPVVMVDLSGRESVGEREASVVSDARVDSGPRGGTKRWLGGVATVAAIVVVGLVALLSGGGSDDAGDPFPTTTMADVSSSAIKPATPETTASPKPTTTQGTVSTTTPPTTTIPYVGQRIGPVLDQSQNGHSLYVASGNALHRIDLATGEVSTIDPLAEFENADWFEILGSSEQHLILEIRPVGSSHGTRQYSIALDLSGPLVELPFSNVAGYSNGGAIWFSKSGRSAPFQRLALDGTVFASIAMPEGWQWATLLEHTIVMERAGRLWAVGSDGLPEVFAAGGLVASNGREVLWEECGDAGECVLVRQSPGESRRAVFRSQIDLTRSNSWSLSPDGAQIASLDGFDDGLVVDLETGAAQAVPHGTTRRGVWSHDGRYFFSGSSDLWASDLKSGARVAMEFDLLDPNNWNQLFYD